MPRHVRLCTLGGAIYFAFLYLISLNQFYCATALRIALSTTKKRSQWECFLICYTFETLNRQPLFPQGLFSPTSALPRASTLFASATNNSQDCWFNASRHREYTERKLRATVLFSARVFVALRGDSASLTTVVLSLFHFAFWGLRNRFPKRLVLYVKPLLARLSRPALMNR